MKFVLNQTCCSSLISSRDLLQTPSIRPDLLVRKVHCCLRKRAAPVCIQRLGLEPQGKQMCVTSFSLSELVYNGSRIESTEREDSAEFLDHNKTIINTCTTTRCFKNTLLHKVPLQNNPELLTEAAHTWRTQAR